mmetsp:Transcript_10321/g.16564  ORF Transcript_10321/g.16564 Transcript_10321/m.16564 type:complete len:308 (+) Transcript_10321:673-1596(+)
MPFKVQIGEAILKKLPNVKTVVVKTGKITDRFRVFPMEVIAGKKDLETEVKEHGCRFRLDYGKVYWNSRLQTEHARIVRMLHRDDIVCDMFCGIGPFAVPAGMKGVKVYANDLNPESFKWLKENVRLNKVSHRVECFNLDGREFVKDITKRIMATEQQLYNVVTMNLPAIAIEFLDVFKDLYPPTFTKDQMPRIHCYCFARGETPEELRKDALDRVEDVLGHKIVQVDVHNVRNVAPKKEMLCLSFDLPCVVGCRRTRNEESDSKSGHNEEMVEVGSKKRAENPSSSVQPVDPSDSNMKRRKTAGLT